MHVVLHIAKASLLVHRHGELHLNADALSRDPLSTDRDLTRSGLDHDEGMIAFNTLAEF